MNKKMRELQEQINQKLAEAKGYMSGETKDLEKAESLMNEADALQKEFELEKRLLEQSKGAVPSDPFEGGDPEEKGKKVDSVKAFADAVRARFKDLAEGVMADGGYTVPQDILTRVERYIEARYSLLHLIDYEHVTTKSGRRTYKKRSQHTGFTKVAEGGKMPKTTAPQFEILEYSIDKYAGFMPVTNELLEDSDAAILNLMVEWLGEEKIATENAQILAKFMAKEAKAITGMDDIKSVVLKDLALFLSTTKIVTNADGHLYLDTLKDKNDRYLLSPDPANPMQMYVTVGNKKIPLEVIPNEILPTAESGAIPFFIGDAKAYMKEFDRKQLTLTTSDVAVAGDFNAFEQDMTLMKGVMRADWRVKDEKALVYCTLTPTA